MAIICHTVVRGESCEAKAKFYVAGSSSLKRDWSSYHCEEHAVRVIKKRMRLIKKYKQYVTLRPITDWDKQQAKARRKRK